MTFWKTKAYNLTETDIRYAMENSRSNYEAARFFKIGYSTYRRYAKMYFDNDSGKTLFELHKNVAGVGIPRKIASRYAGKKGMVDILDGKCPEYPFKKMKKRLIHEGYREECCELCGFEERRLNDYTVPLILVWKDGDKTNHNNDNLILMCYNDFYLTQGNLFNRRADRTDFKGYRNDD